MSHDSSLTEIAEKLGFEYSTKADETLQYGFDRLFARETRPRVKWLMERERDGARLVVARLALREEGQNTSRLYYETILFFQQPGLRMPNLLVEPKKFTSTVTTGMMKLMGMPGVPIEHDAEFSKRYTAVSFQPETALELLTPEIRNSLSEHEGLTVRSENDRLVVYRRKLDLPAEDVPAFIDEADDVVRLLVLRARQFPEIRVSPDAEAHETIENMGGVMGAIMRSMVVHKDQIDAFLDQPPPRRTAPFIRKHYFGYGSLVFYILGGVLLFVVGPLIASLSVNREISGLMTGLLTLLPLGGLCAIVLTFLYRRNWKRMLFSGDICDARVTRVKSTSMHVNNRLRSRVTMEFQHAGQERKATINEYEPAVLKARSLVDSDATTRILVNPGNSHRLVWIDGLWQ